MFESKLSKLISALTEARGEQAALERRLETLLQRQEDLRTLPLPRADFVALIQELLDGNQTTYPKRLMVKLEALAQNPLKQFNFGNVFNPLLLFGPNVDPEGLLFLLGPQIRKAVADVISAAPWPEVVGPPRAARLVELEKIGAEIADIQGKLEALRAAAQS